MIYVYVYTHFNYQLYTHTYTHDCINGHFSKFIWVDLSKVSEQWFLIV